MIGIERKYTRRTCTYSKKMGAFISTPRCNPELKKAYDALRLTIDAETKHIADSNFMLATSTLTGEEANDWSNKDEAKYKALVSAREAASQEYFEINLRVTAGICAELIASKAENNKNMRAANDAARKMHTGAKLQAIEAENDEKRAEADYAARKLHDMKFDKLVGRA